MIKSGYVSLKKRLLPYRTACISIVIGVFAVVLVSVISAVGNTMIEKELDSLGLDSIAIGTSDSGEGESVLNEAVYASVTSVPGIEDSTPVIMDTGTYRLGAQDEAKTIFWGISQSAQNIIALDVVHGRMFSPEELNNAEKVCLVDESVAQAAYRRTDITGKTVMLELNGIADEYKIVGVIKAGSSLLNSVTGSMIPNFIYVPYTTLSFFSAKNGYDQIIVKASPDQDIQTVKSSISHTLDTFSTAEIPQNFRMNDLFNQRQTVSSIVMIASAVMMLIAGVALLVSGIAVMNSVSNAVQVRRREIGIKKSLGASVPKILLELIGDILTGTLLSVAVGIFLGSSLLACIITLANLPYRCNTLLLGIGIIAMVVIALLFGIVPALRAAKMKPVDALREE